MQLPPFDARDRGQLRARIAGPRRIRDRQQRSIGGQGVVCGQNARGAIRQRIVAGADRLSKGRQRHQWITGGAGQRGGIIPGRDVDRAVRLRRPGTGVSGEISDRAGGGGSGHPADSRRQQGGREKEARLHEPAFAVVGRPGQPPTRPPAPSPCPVASRGTPIRITPKARAGGHHIFG